MIIALAVFGWFRIFAHAREAALSGGLTLTAMRVWWASAGGLYSLMFLVSTVLLLSLLRLLGRQLRVYEIVALIAHIFVVWLLFFLAAITSDSLSLSALSPIGLASLHWWLYGIASLWILLLLYTLFSTIDRSRSESAVASN